MRHTKEWHTYCTSYCNKPHDMADGKPIAHNCYVLNPAALNLESQGSYREAQDIGMVLLPRVEMSRGKRRRTA